jgi:hypothetical protein
MSQRGSARNWGDVGQHPMLAHVGRDVGKRLEDTSLKGRPYIPISLIISVTILE